MIVHRALYGFDRGGHAFLRGSSADRAGLFSAITWRTDLPATAPYGVSWTPYLRGFAEAGHYVLVRTAPDIAAPRAGMVFSQAAFVRSEHLCSVDWHRLAAALKEVPDRSQPLSPIEVAGPPDRESASSTAVSIMDKMIRSAMKPAVHVGQADFDDAVLQILGKLPGRLKERFTFRLSFGPQDVENDPQDVVSTPDLLETRWHGYPVIPKLAPSGPPRRAVAFLLELDGGRDLGDFADRLGTNATDLRSIGRLEEAWAIAEKEPRSVEDNLGLVRLISLISPRSSDGSDFKAVQLARLAACLTSARPDQIRWLRNLDLSAFSNPRPCWDAVLEWAAAQAGNVGYDRDVLQVAMDSVSDGPVAPWRGAILGGFRARISRLDSAVAESLWSAITKEPQIAEMTLSLLPANPTAEAIVRRTLPSRLDPTVASYALDLAKSRGWWTLHGRCLALTRAPEAALDAQLAVDRDLHAADGIEAALSIAEPADRLKLALSHEDIRLIPIAGAECASNPALMAGFDASNIRWLDILQSAVSRSNVLDGLEQGHSLVGSLVDLPHKADHYAPLWRAVAQSKFADLLDLPGRSRVWSRIPNEVRPKFLSATADGWLAGEESGRHSGAVIEPELESSIVEPTRISGFLARAIPDRLEGGVKLFQRFRRLGEREFNDWLAQVDSRMKYGGVTKSAATKLGRLVSSGFWSSSARRILELAKQRGDMVPALLECRHLLPIWEYLNPSVWAIKGVPDPDEDELWRILEKIVVQLYPYGPEENEIWSRASGRIDALSQDGNPLARWHSALRRLRSGGGGIPPARLVAEMRRDFPLNRELDSITAFKIFREVGDHG